MDHAREHFAIVGQCTLPNFLWISNVQSSRLLELIVRMATLLLDNFHDFFATDRDLPTNGIFSRNHVLAETVKDGLISAEWPTAES